MKVMHKGSISKGTLWDVHRAFQPLFSVSAVLGVLPVSSTRIAGGGRSRLENFSLACSALCFLLNLVLLLGAPVILWGMRHALMASVANTTDKYEDSQYFPMAYPLSILLSGVCSRYVSLTKLRKNLPLILAKLSHGDTVLQTPTDLHRNNYTVSLFITIVTAVVTAALNGLLLLDSYTLQTFPSFIIVFYFCMWSVEIVETQFIMLCWMLKKRFQLLNVSMKRIGSRHISVLKACDFKSWRISTRNSDFQMVESVEVLRKCHLELCEILRDINGSYQLYLLFSLPCGFINIVICSYVTIYGFDYMTSIGYWAYIIMALRSTYHAVFFVTIAVIAGITSEEAAQTRTVAASLNSRSLHPSAKEEIANFVTQIDSQQLGFSVFSLFTLNSQLVTAAVSTTVTYLVILAQFRPSPGSAQGTSPTSPPGSPGHKS